MKISLSMQHYCNIDISHISIVVTLIVKCLQILNAVLYILMLQKMGMIQAFQEKQKIIQIIQIMSL